MAKHVQDRNGTPGPDGRSTIDRMDIGDERQGPAAPSWVLPSDGGGGDGFLAARDDDLRRQYPTLHEFLTLQGWGGKARKTGSISVFAEDGKFKSCINDRDGGHYAFVSSDSVQGLLEALEHGLKAGKLDWRKSKGFKR